MTQSRDRTVVIGMLATLAICIQNVGSLLAFGWASIHGAGATALVAFLPAALGAAVLWGGYLFLANRSSDRLPLIFTVFVLAVLTLNEVLLPATPLKMWVSRRAAAAVEVRNIRDEPLLSPRGNPLGIRILFEVTVPTSGPYSIGATALAPVIDNPAHITHFSMGVRQIVVPEPVPAEDGLRTFRAGEVYTFTSEMPPDFVRLDETGESCLHNVVRPWFSQADFLPTLAKSRSLKYRTSVTVHSRYGDRVEAINYVTAHSYDLEAIYRTVVAEGNRRCQY